MFFHLNIKFIILLKEFTSLIYFVNKFQGYKFLDYKMPFEGILREGNFEGNILLAETYCYN